jgi:hypothetical protein
MFLMVLAIVGITLYGNPLLLPIRSLLSIILMFQLATAAPRYVSSLFRQRRRM